MESGMLSGYRILDLTDEQGLFCGKLLGDMGADVIKVEKPGGDRARRIGPYYHDINDPEKSLFWFAFNTSKRGITLDIENDQGRSLFKELIGKSDAVIDSFAPGYLEHLGLGYAELSRINPGIVMTNISPFGPSGPYKDFKATDLTLWALSGLLFICGDRDRAPVRISLPQSYLHAGADAAAGTVMALYHRGMTGEGQQVHVSIMKAMERVAYAAYTIWDARGKILKRSGSSLRIPPLGTTTPVIWPCKNGYVAFYLFGGNMGAVSNPALTRWMEEEGLASEVMQQMDWPTFDIGATPQQDIDAHIIAPIRTFFSHHTQEELWDGGIKRRVMVYPVNDARGVLGEAQLKERNFWVEVYHSHLADSLTYPGPFIKTSEASCRIRGRAPLIGEDNTEIYENELGLSQERLSELQAMNVI